MIDLMLTRMTIKFDGVAESQAEYAAIDDYEHEHRCAEHEYEGKNTPENTDCES